MKRRDFLAQTGALIGAAVMPAEVNASAMSASQGVGLPQASDTTPPPEEMFTPQQTYLLEQLGDALLPLDEWIQHKHYIPEKNPSWIETLPGLTSGSPPPWRGKSLSVSQIGLGTGLKILIRSSSADSDLVARWNHRKANPLELCPVPNREDWRASRGLRKDAKFAIYESGNVFLDGTGTPLVRYEFYRLYLPLLESCIKAAPPADRAAWQEFGSALASDKARAWPVNSPASSVFVKQFLRDSVAVLLGMRNTSFVAEKNVCICRADRTRGASPQRKFLYLRSGGENRGTARQCPRKELADEKI
jgi:hypothetical protein